MKRLLLCHQQKNQNLLQVVDVVLLGMEKSAAVSGCSKEANVRQIFLDSVFVALLGTFSLISW